MRKKLIEVALPLDDVNPVLLRDLFRVGTPRSLQGRALSAVGRGRPAAAVVDYWPGCANAESGK